MESTTIKRIAYHFLFIVIYFIYETINAAWTGGDRFDFTEIHKVWATIPVILCAVYVNLYVLMPLYLYKRRYAEYVLWLSVLLIVWGFSTRFMGYQFWLAWDKEHMPEKYATEPKEFFVPIRIARNIFRLYPALALTMLIKIFRDSYSKEKQMRAAEAERHKAEISNLRAQVHPHFFFNTLSSLYSLTLKRSDKAADVVMRLSDLMHYVLYETNSERVLLEGELKHVRDFIAIEQLRFGDSIDISFQASGDITGKRIGPLLLIPFVENAFKHCQSTESGSAWATISVKVSGHRLFFAVENSASMEPVENNSRTGIGLMNARKRLALSYPHRHELLISKKDNVFKVELKLDLNEEG